MELILSNYVVQLVSYWRKRFLTCNCFILPALYISRFVIGLRIHSVFSISKKVLTNFMQISWIVMSKILCREVNIFPMWSTLFPKHWVGKKAISALNKIFDFDDIRFENVWCLWSQAIEWWIASSFAIAKWLDMVCPITWIVKCSIAQIGDLLRD